MNPNTIDFLAIGDITTDAFIRIKNASVTCDIDHRNCKLSLNFADKVPYEFTEIVSAVGNSPNAAVAAARLGLNTALVTNLGTDNEADACIAQLKKEQIDTTFVTKHLEKKTNYHYVLWYEDERTILIKHEAYVYKFPVISNSVKYIYLSSIGEHGKDIYKDIASFLKARPETKLIFQPGTFQMKLGVTFLNDIYRMTHVLACNVEEAQRILDTKEADVKILMKELAALGPKIVLVSDGPKGAYAHDGTTSWFMPIYPDPKPPYERTGAGDAFTSTFAIALAKGKTIEEALLWAPINQMSVVQYVGAQHGLLSEAVLEKLLKDAPADYKPRII